MKSEKYKKALRKNLYEIAAAIFELRAFVGLLKADAYHYHGFITIVHGALFFSYLGRSAKVLDRHRDAGGFFYLYNLNRKGFEKIFNDFHADISFFEEIADKIKHIRDKVLFHIDRAVLIDNSNIWKDAGLGGDELISCLNTIFKILQCEYEIVYGDTFDIPKYNGRDAKKIAIFASELSNNDIL